MKHILEHKKRYLFFLSIFIFIVFAGFLLFGNMSSFDSNVYKWIAKLKTPEVTTFFCIITEFGGAFVLIFLVAILFLIFPKKEYGKWMTINLIFITILNFVLKNVFMRERPDGFQIIEEWGYSFPSGHAMVSFAFYGLLAYFIYKKGTKKIRYLWITLLLLLSLLIGISRIYLGVHYASDVLAGFALSLSFLMLYIHYFIEPRLKKAYVPKL